jgi:hypothetical protein
MYGSRKRGVHDERYDSKQEAAVASHFETLITERLVGGYVIHPHVAGFHADFLVALGTQSDHPGRLVVVEYDGLGLKRLRDLQHKVLRYAELAAFGFEQAWITSPTLDAVKAALESPGPPRLVRKTSSCPLCKKEAQVHVICDHCPTEIEVREVCSRCRTKPKPNGRHHHA